MNFIFFYNLFVQFPEQLKIHFMQTVMNFLINTRSTMTASVPSWYRQITGAPAALVGPGSAHRNCLQTFFLNPSYFGFCYDHTFAGSNLLRLSRLFCHEKNILNKLDLNHIDRSQARQLTSVSQAVGSSSRSYPGLTDLNRWPLDQQDNEGARTHTYHWRSTGLGLRAAAVPDM